MQETTTSLDQNSLTQSSELVMKEAYSHMSLDINHTWHNFAHSDIHHIISILTNHSFDFHTCFSCADFGCGTGRHLQTLKQLFPNSNTFVGIDCISSLIQNAKENCSPFMDSIHFVVDDCRTIALTTQFDLIFCLYDVIGSFCEEQENEKIIQNIAKHVKSNGFVAVSVMSFYKTLETAKYKGIVPQDWYKVTQLTCSHTMKHTGDIFNPNFYFVDEESKLVYRKEIMNEKELLVVDRRYTMEELVLLFKKVGIEKVDCYATCAGFSKRVTEAKGKEILFIGKKLKPQN